MLLNDVRHALRTLRSSPTFSLTAVVVLALGIGSNSAMFSLVNGLLFKPLPVTDPARLVLISAASSDEAGVNYTLSYEAYRRLRAATRAFSGLFARSGLSLNVVAGTRSEQVRGEIVTGDYFRTLGVRPYLGRLLTPDDDRAIGSSPVAVLDYEYWRGLGGDRSIVGSAILVNGKSMTVVGVTPPEFFGTNVAERPKLRVPMSMAPVLRTDRPDRLTNPRVQWLTLIARMAPGVTLAQAQAQASVVFDRLTAELAVQRKAARGSSAYRLVLEPGERGAGNVRRASAQPVLLLTGATALVLLVACANLANLLLARGAVRGRELALRLALGASRLRLLRMLLIESLLLSLAGGMMGLVAAFWITDFVAGLLPAGSALGHALSPDARSLAATFALSLLTGLLFGAWPAWSATRQAPAPALKREAAPIAHADRFFSARSALVVVQVALSLVLLVGAGLFVRTLSNLEGLDTGFTRDNVLVAGVDPSLNGYTPERSRLLLGELVGRVASLPGVRGAGVTTSSPISGSWDVLSVTVPGYQPAAGEEPDACVSAISPGYLESLQIGLVAGRPLEWQDAAGRPNVALVNETMARKYFGGTAAAIGRQFFFTEGRPVEIVGVVRDAKYVDLREERRRFVYVPFTQVSFTEMVLHVRTTGDPLAQAGSVREQLHALDAALPLYDVTTLEGQVDRSLASERILATLGVAFGVSALLLAAVGLYGLLAFSVARRTREIGVRTALGARPADIGRLVFARTGMLVTSGLVVGLAGSLTLAFWVRSLLFNVAGVDPAVLFGATVLVAATSAVAAALPARRAIRIDPLNALREE